jgi:hypothetical protein
LFAATNNNLPVQKSTYFLKLSQKKENVFPLTFIKKKMAPQARFELATDRLTADSSTTELLRNIEMVGLSGLEPPTSRLSGVRSNQLSYRPINNWSG